MGEIQGTKRSPEYLAGKPNKLLGAKEVKFYLVHFTNADGRVGTCLAGHFVPTRPEEEGRSIVMEEETIPNLYNEPKPWFQEALNRFLKRVNAGETPASAIPDPQLGSLELGESADSAQQG